MTLANNTKSKTYLATLLVFLPQTRIQENSPRADAAIIKGAPRLFKYYDPWVWTHSTCVYASSTTNTSKYIVKTLSFRKFANTCLKASSCEFILVPRSLLSFDLRFCKHEGCLSIGVQLSLHKATKKEAGLTTLQIKWQPLKLMNLMKKWKHSIWLWLYISNASVQLGMKVCYKLPLHIGCRITQWRI